MRNLVWALCFAALAGGLLMGGGLWVAYKGAQDVGHVVAFGLKSHSFMSTVNRADKADRLPMRQPKPRPVKARAPFLGPYCWPQPLFCRIG
jgi:hypothetical protein